MKVHFNSKRNVLKPKYTATKTIPLNNKKIGILGISQ